MKAMGDNPRTPPRYRTASNDAVRCGTCSAFVSIAGESGKCVMYDVKVGRMKTCSTWRRRG